MQEKARSCGLRLDPAGVPDVTPENGSGAITDSFKAFLGGLFSLFKERYFRPIGATRFGQECVDQTAHGRYLGDVTYRPKNHNFRSLALGPDQ